METVDIIIPAYRPGNEFEKLLDSLSTQNYPVEKILVMNTEEKFWNTAWEKKFPNNKNIRNFYFSCDRIFFNLFNVVHIWNVFLMC